MDMDDGHIALLLLVGTILLALLVNYITNRQFFDKYKHKAKLIGYTGPRNPKFRKNVYQCKKCGKTYQLCNDALDDPNNLFWCN